MLVQRHPPQHLALNPAADSEAPEDFEPETAGGFTDEPANASPEVEDHAFLATKAEPVEDVIPNHSPSTSKGRPAKRKEGTIFNFSPPAHEANSSLQ